ncbi:hypothetical protein GQ473_03865 [archaeon]|nr:hypothetical protein [archaeon]
MFDKEKQKVMTDIFDILLNNVLATDLYPKKAYDELEVVSVVDKTGVISIEAKTKDAKKLLYPFLSVHVKIHILDLLYQTTAVYNKCKYSTPFIKYAIELLNASDEDTIDISLREEYPITLENQHFSIIIAPRMD